MRKGSPHTGCGQRVRISHPNLTEIIYLQTSNEVLDTGDSLWHAGLFLANYLCENPDMVGGKCVLELGAGLGLVGLVSAALGARRVVLTDLPGPQQELLRSNVELNRTMLTCRGCDCTVAVHEFGEPFASFNPYVSSGNASDSEGSDISSSLAVEKIDLLLGSDLGFDPGLLESLARSVGMVLRGRNDGIGVRALLAEEVRWRDVHQWYQDALALELGLGTPLSLRPNGGGIPINAFDEEVTRSAEYHAMFKGSCEVCNSKWVLSQAALPPTSRMNSSVSISDFGASSGGDTDNNQNKHVYIERNIKSSCPLVLFEIAKYTPTE